MNNINRIDDSWTLFLDRDGVINKKRENDYVKNCDEFEFVDGALNAISVLSKKFITIVIVTNQRGVGKGLMTENDLLRIHEYMLHEINAIKGRIDNIYYCTEVSDESFFRKPNIGMALKAKCDYPIINFSKSIMVGDSLSDMQFADNLGMVKVIICRDKYLIPFTSYDYSFNSLFDFAVFVK